MGVSRKVVQARKSGVDRSAACDVSSASMNRVGSWFLTSSGLSPITTYRMLTCLDRWNPKSLRDGIATGKVWQVSRDEPGHGSTMLWLPGPE